MTVATLATKPESFLPPRSAELVLPIEGMTCAGCARRVERALRAAPGVRAAAVNAALDRAEVTLDSDAGSPAGLVAAVREAGYGVAERRFVLEVEPQARATLAAQPGVIHVEHAADGRIEVIAVAGAVERDDLDRAAAAAGYAAATAAEPEPDARPDAAAAAECRRLLLAAALTLPLLAPMALAPFGFHGHLPPLLELMLAAPVQLVLGARFYRGALAALRARSGNMDLLVALGTSAAFFYSLVLVLRLGDAATGRLYFEAAAVVVTLVLLGKWLEARAKRGASAALRELMALRPETATVLRDGREASLPIAQLRPGDVVIARPGERIAVDGTVLDGESEVDEALVTGESMPVTKGAGDAVIAGAINGPGRLRIRAERLGRDTTLARIARLVEAAQMGKAPIQRLVDRVSGVFVPVVVALAAVTCVAWLLLTGDVERALAATVAVLVIACPCALGLATPTALVAGTGAAARSGILIRDIEALERAHGLTTIVFDKTGTLTRGRPEVSGVLPAAGSDESELLSVAAAAQRGSEHPLGRAVVDLAAARGFAIAEPRSFRALPGRGLQAEVAGRRVVVGTRELMAEHGIDVATVAGDAAARGETVSWVAADGRLLGGLAFRDALREHAGEAIRALSARGVGTVLLSGDHRSAAEQVAAVLGIAEVDAPVRPEGKAEAIARLRAAGRVVGMVGDGVNDAPALAAADVGIAMGSGADVALATAGITLMRPDLRLVPAALDIARRTWRKIRQNLFWAFAYNLVALPLAAFGLLTPGLAAAAMALSSVSVVLNALTLRGWRPLLASRADL